MVVREVKTPGQKFYETSAMNPRRWEELKPSAKAQYEAAAAWLAQNAEAAGK